MQDTTNPKKRESSFIAQRAVEASGRTLQAGMKKLSSMGVSQFEILAQRVSVEDAKWQDMLNDRILSQSFIWLCIVGGLPLPGTPRLLCPALSTCRPPFARPPGSMRDKNKQIGIYRVYLSLLQFLFVGCFVLCFIRLVKQDKPGFRNAYVNISLLLFHLWLPFAHMAVSRLLVVQNRTERPFDEELAADDPLCKLDADEEAQEDFARRSSLQHALATLANRHAALKRQCELTTEAEHTPLSLRAFRARFLAGKVEEIDYCEFDARARAIFVLHK